MVDMPLNQIKKLDYIKLRAAVAAYPATTERKLAETFNASHCSGSPVKDWIGFSGLKTWPA